MLGMILIATSKAISIIRLILLAIMLLIISPYVITKIDNYQSYTYLTNIIATEKKFSKPIDDMIKEYLPTKINNRDITPFVKILILLILMAYLRTLQWHVKYNGYYMIQKQALKDLKKKTA